MFEREISTFSHRVGVTANTWVDRKPPTQDGLEYFQDNFFSIFNLIQQEGQRLLDELSTKITWKEQTMLARHLQYITEETMVNLKERLLENADTS